MNLPVRPGPPANVLHLMQAQNRDRALEQELAAVRTAATAWRNGLWALLAAVIGFGLIKGRSDISQLASPWNALSGALLLVSLACGVVASILLLRAAHGVPALQNLRITRPGGGTGRTPSRSRPCARCVVASAGSSDASPA